MSCAVRAPCARCRDGLIITELCRTLLQAGHGRLTEQRCRVFLEAFQSVTVLRRGELYLFPAAMRAAVIQALAAVCRDMLNSSDAEAYAQELEALFSSLRLLSSMDMERLLDSVDVCSAILSRDPTGDYPKMDRETKAEYLRRLEIMAARRDVEEYTLASELIEKSQAENRHVGFLLLREPGRVGRGAVYRRECPAHSFYQPLHFLFPRRLWLAALLLLPVSELVKAAVDFLLMRVVRPRPMPRLDLSEGVPEEGKSICVISVILGSCDAQRLEALRLASRREGKNLSFGLLADLPGAATAETPRDAQLLRDAQSAIDALNEKYGGGFYLFTRERSYNGESYSGRERKRGALIELARLLCGEDSELSVTGDEAALRGTRYIITLDADTRIYPVHFRC